MDPMQIKIDLEQTSMLIVALEKVTFEDKDNRQRLEDKLTGLLMKNYEDNTPQNPIIHEQDV